MPKAALGTSPCKPQAGSTPALGRELLFARRTHPKNCTGLSIGKNTRAKQGVLREIPTENREIITFVVVVVLFFFPVH